MVMVATLAAKLNQISYAVAIHQFALELHKRLIAPPNLQILAGMALD